MEVTEVQYSSLIVAMVTMQYVQILHLPPRAGVTVEWRVSLMSIAVTISSILDQ